VKRLEFVPPNNNSFTLFITTFALFVIATVAEIGGGYLVWQWLRERKKIGFGLIGGFTLFLYGVIPTFQPSSFGRVYAAYGGIFVVMAILWGLIIDKKRPDRYEIIGGIIVLVGASIIFYSPR
jgi:small multidrug resistance family-3 protein